MSMIDSKITFSLATKLAMTDRYGLAFNSGVTVKSFDLYAIALTHTIVVTMPTFSGATVTGTFSIENSYGEEIFSQGSLAESTVHVITQETPLVGKNTIKITLDTDPLSDGTVYVTMYLKGNGA